jgi:hypothetical protein
MVARAHLKWEEMKVGTRPPLEIFRWRDSDDRKFGFDGVLNDSEDSDWESESSDSDYFTTRTSLPCAPCNELTVFRALCHASPPFYILTPVQAQIASDSSRCRLQIGNFWRNDPQLGTILFHFAANSMQLKPLYPWSGIGVIACGRGGEGNRTSGPEGRTRGWLLYIRAHWTDRRPLSRCCIS